LKMKLVEVREVRARMAPFCCHTPSAKWIMCAQVAVFALDLFVISFYVKNTITPSGRWQQIENMASDIYHIPKVLCGKVNLVISLALIGTAMEFAIGCRAVYWDLKPMWINELRKSDNQRKIKRISGKNIAAIATVVIAVFILEAFLIHALVKHDL